MTSPDDPAGRADPVDARPAGPPPAAAQLVFRDRLALAVRYVDALAGPGVDRGLIGPRERPRLWARHVLNCAVVAELIPSDSEVLDLGSGAGLPGVPLALSRPDLRVVLVEPMERRAAFLNQVVADLDGPQLSVVRARAEELAGSVAVPVLTARAVAPLARLLGWAVPLLQPGGRLLALKGRSAADELRAATGDLRRLRAESARVVQVGGGVLEEATTVVEVVAGAVAPSRASRGEPVGPRQRSRGRRGGL